MKTKNSVRKITLSRETLRLLEGEQLLEAVAGVATAGGTCPYTCQRSCSCLTRCL
ncbi:MAG TPA: hypothetical protein VMW75_06660 [Thermoanaerobaculia bacterium]|nr:hypothetical protein [Thermoanaerobaculia bacterium]